MKKFSKLIPALLSLPFLMGAYYPETTSYDGLEIISDNVTPHSRTGYEIHTIELKNNKEGYVFGSYVHLKTNDSTYFVEDEEVSFNYAILPNENKTLTFVTPENTTSYTLESEALFNPVDMNVRGISDLVKEAGGYYGYYYSFTFESDVTTRHYYEAIIVFGDNTYTYNNILYLGDAVDGRINVQVTSPVQLNAEEATVKDIVIFEGEGDRGKERIESISLVVTSILTSLFFLLIIYGGLALIVMVIIQTAIIKKKSPKKDK